MKHPLLLMTALAALSGCDDKRNESLKSLAPAPLPSLGKAPPPGALTETPEQREQLFHVPPAPIFGLPTPPGAIEIKLHGTQAFIAGRTLEMTSPGAVAALREVLGPGKVVCLSADSDTYLAQASYLLAALDDLGVETWLRHPTAPVGYHLVLRDEPGFQSWLDEPKPGKIRIIQRADGYELQTNVGKLAGADPNGPTVPARSGQLDIATLRHGLELLKGRFTTTVDSCLVPSFGTSLSSIGATLSANYRAPGEPFFEAQCLVYPRPVVQRAKGP